MALSYCWTKASPAREIRLDEQPFWCRPNLHNFLTLCRLEALSRRIFIDALCINQEDMAERESQIQLMRRIYSDASEVVAWLGLPDEYDLMGQHFWEHPYDCDATRKPWMLTRTAYWALVEQDPPPGPYGHFMSRENPLTILEETLFYMLESFMRWEFFSRVWIVQELLLARSLIFRCGAVSLTSESLRKCLSRIHISSNPIPPQRGRDTPSTFDTQRLAASFLAERVRLEAVRVGGGPPAPLYKVLRMTFAQRSTHPLDVVFGILGLSDSSIIPNYSMSKLELLVRALVDCCTRTTDSPRIERWGTRNITYPCLALMYALDIHPRQPTVALVVCEIITIFEEAYSQAKSGWLTYTLVLNIWLNGGYRHHFGRVGTLVVKSSDRMNTTMIGDIYGRVVSLGLRLWRSRNLTDPDDAQRVMSRAAWVAWTRTIAMDQLQKQLQSGHDPGRAAEVLRKLETYHNAGGKGS